MSDTKQEKQALFSKNGILKSSRWKGDRAVLEELLEEDKRYSVKDIDGILKAFYGKVVK